MQKIKLLLTKPSYVVFGVLELSKFHMMRYSRFLFPFFSTDISPFSFWLSHFHSIVSSFAIHIHSTIQYTTIPTYRFYHNVTKKKYGNKAQVLFTDTDSLLYHGDTADM